MRQPINGDSSVRYTVFQVRFLIQTFLHVFCPHQVSGKFERARDVLLGESHRLFSDIARTFAGGLGLTFERAHAKYGLPEHPDPTKNEATVVIIYSVNDDGPDVFIFPADGRNLRTPEIVSNGVQTPGFRWKVGSETATLGRKKCKAL